MGSYSTTTEQLWAIMEPFSLLQCPADFHDLLTNAFPEVDHRAHTYRLSLWATINNETIRDPERMIFRWWTTASGSPAPKRRPSTKSKTKSISDEARDILS